MAKVNLVPVKKPRSALRLEEGLTAMDGYEEEFGAFTEEETAAADAILDRHFGVSSPAT